MYVTQAIDTIKANGGKHFSAQGRATHKSRENANTHDTTYSWIRLLRLPRVSGIVPLSWLLSICLLW